MNARQFGMYLACVEDGVRPSSLPVLEGMAKRASSEDFGAVGRKIASLACNVLRITGRGYSAPAFHLHFISKSADWNRHTQEVVDDVVRAVRALEPMQKVAFSDAMSAAHTAMKGGWYGSLGLGAGLGALYWLLSRHANQDASDIESMNRQVNYYHELSRELDDSMRRKYRYDRSKPTAESNPASEPAVTSLSGA